MADLNYWTALMNGGNPEMIPGAGSALPEENAILKLLNKGQKQNPLLNAKKIPVVAAQPRLPEALTNPPPDPFNPSIAPVAKGSGLTNKAMEQEKVLDEDTDTKKQLAQTQRKLIIDDPTFDRLMERTTGLPIFQEQQAGINKMKDMLAIAAEAPTDIFSGPLAGLLEAEFGRKTSGFQANRGMSPQDQQKAILGYQDKIQDNQKDYASKLFEAVGKQQGGTQLDSYLSQIVGRGVVENVAQNTAVAEDPNKYAKVGRGKGAPDYSKDMKELGKNRANVSSAMLNTFDRIDAELADDGGLAGLRNSAKGVKGVGGVKAFVPIGWRDDKPARLYNLAFDLAKQKLQLRSGAAASDKEAAGYLKQFGLSPSSGAREMANGLTKMVDDVHSYLKSDEARFRPGVVEQYRKNPGAIISSDLEKYKPGAPINQKTEGKAKKPMTMDEWIKAGRPTK